MNYQDVNAETIDRWVKEGWEWGKPVDHETFVQAKKGDWDILLTPTKPVPKDWLGDLKGKKVLGLASGGGQQMPILSVAGAKCTVLDYSDQQLESERLVAEREGYDIEIVKADMTKPLPFEDGAFDLVIQPVANCYIEELQGMFNEVARVLAPGGVFLMGFDNGINYFFADQKETEVVNIMPFNPLKNPDQMAQLEKDDCGVQFSHSLEEEIGGQLKAGLTLTDLYEDTNGEGHLHELHIPTFVATRCVKKG